MKRERTEIASAGRPPGRPRDEGAHLAILRAAIDLTREVGYDALALEAVAARAGVGKATIYRRWSGKETLMAEAVDYLVRTLPAPDTGSTEGDLFVIMRTTMMMYQDPATPPLLSGLVAAMARSALIAAKIRDGFVAARRNAMRDVLLRGIGRGDLAPDTDVELALDLLSGPMLWRSLIAGLPVDEPFTRGILRAVLRAFAPDAGSPYADSPAPGGPVP